MKGDPKKPRLMRSLGAFVGEIVKAVKTDPSQKVERRHEPAGDDEVVLRRTTTTVDEVCIRKSELPQRRE